MSTSYWKFLFFCFSLYNLLFLGTIQAQEKESKNSILIICSYNPAAHQTSMFISDFMDEYQLAGGRSNVEIENMNCKSFMEAARWKNDMHHILTKYQGENTPKMIVLLGQEAWAAYISQDSVIVSSPAICSLASRNAVILPSDTISLKDWMPESVDLYADSLGRQKVRTGFVYEYDIPSNIRMIKHFYPDTKHIAFLSDNTYGGVSMQALMRKEMKNFPELDLILLDGRTHTVYTLTEKINKLPSQTAILLGTWRVDMNEGYFLRNATYSMMEANPKLPAFSLSTIGFGYWAVGGVMPAYRDLGRDMAREAYYLEKHPQENNRIVVIGSDTLIDSQRAKEIGLDLRNLPFETKIVNKELTVYEQYTYQIWTGIAIVGILVTGLCLSLFYYYRARRLSIELMKSEHELREAKDRAEESNRLKSAFLANMSHEIRTPLNAIVGFSDVLVAGGITDDEERQGFADIIKLNSDLLLRLINDILDVSRLESGRMVLSPQTNDIVQLCRQALTSIEFARKTSNQFVFDCELESYELKTDTQRFQQVLTNLLSNAVKFTNDGTITLKLEIDHTNHMAVVSVSDTGCGIPLEKQKRVFERFEKLNEYAQGTGLGLAICQLTVEKWGGKIWIDRNYRTGARFIFTHPIEEEKSIHKTEQ